MSVEPIPLTHLAVAFIPAAIVIALMWRWRVGYQKALYAFLRMLVQLLMVGYALVYIFASDSGFVVAGILSTMVLASSWIALNTVKTRKRDLFFGVFCFDPCWRRRHLAVHYPRRFEPRPLVRIEHDDSAGGDDFCEFHDQYFIGGRKIDRRARKWDNLS